MVYHAYNNCIIRKVFDIWLGYWKWVRLLFEEYVCMSVFVIDPPSDNLLWKVKRPSGIGGATKNTQYYFPLFWIAASLLSENRLQKETRSIYKYIVPNL